MSYIIEQKIGKNIYVYEAKSVWDKDKKQPRQIRKYIGKKDPDTGKIIRTKKIPIPRVCLDYGNFYFLKKIAEKIGLEKVLRSCFPDIYNEILTCAFFQISECKPLYLCESWLNLTYSDIKKKLSSQRISELLEDIGKRVNERVKFFSLWAKKRKETEAVVFDITSLSTYSKIGMAEWGYNRDGENLKQVNLGVVFGEPSSLPIFYSLYPGSIPDVVTLKNILKFVKAIKLKKVVFILDRGFYSMRNILDMEENNMRFIIPLPFSTNLAQKLIKKHSERLEEVSNSFIFNKRVLFHRKDRVSIGNYIFNSYIFLDKKRKIEEEENFLTKFLEIEDKVKEGKFKKEEEIEDFLDNNLKGWRNFLEIRKGVKGFTLKRNEAKMNEILMRMGKVILLSNYEAKRDDVLFLYRRKNDIERFFNDMKNELEGRRIRVHSEERLEGKLFLNFISLILYSWIKKMMKIKDLFKSYTVQEIIYEFKKIKILEIEENVSIITEISKKQRELFEKFEIPPPLSPSYKKAGF